MSKHTPGPWRLVGWTAPDDYGWSVKIGTAPHRIDLSAWSEESEGDARLIAAAPDYFEAAEKLARYTGPLSEAVGIFQELMAAHKKAKGES